MHFTGRQTASKITGKKKSRTCEAKDGTKRYQGSEVTLIDLRDFNGVANLCLEKE